MDQQNQSQNLPTQTPPSKLHQHKPLYFVLAIIAMLAIGGLTYVAIEHFKADEEIMAVSNPLPGNGDDDVKDWEVYRNEEYGFEFRYPEDWLLDGDNLFPQDGIGITSPDDDIGSGTITIVRERGRLADFLNRNGYKEIERGQQNYNGNIWTIVIDQDNREASLQFYTAWVDRNGFVWSIGTRNFSESVRIANQILSTFKFIKPKTSEKTRYLPVGVVLEWTKDTKWNFDPPNTFITYSNTDEGFSFQIPFNENWGTDEIKLKPYEVTPDGAVYFGNVSVSCEGGCVMGKDTHVYVNNHQSAESVIADLNNNKNYREGVFVAKPTIVSLGDLKAVEYEYGELGSEKFVIVIGKKFNYVFRASNVEIKDLEKTAKTIKFIE